MGPAIIPRAGVAEERLALSRASRPVPATTPPEEAESAAALHLEGVLAEREALLRASFDAEVAEAVAAHERAQAEALERLRATAREEGIESGRVEGLEAGRGEGRAAAEAEAQRAAQEHAERIAATLAAIETARDAACAASEADAIAIGFAAACKLLGESLVTREGVAARVAQVIGGVRATEHIVVRLSVADLALLGGQVGGGIGAPRVELVVDPTLAAGDCVVETGAGTLEARLERALEDLKAVLLRAHGAAEGAG